jgi:hypothetical protein
VYAPNVLENALSTTAAYLHVAGGEKLEWSAGARLDDHSQDPLPASDVFALSPRGAARYHTTDDFALILEAGRYHQLGPDQALAVAIDLRPYETSDQLSGGFEIRTGNVLTEIQAYYRTVDDIQELQGQTIVGRFGNAFGCEWRSVYNDGPTRGWVIYQYSRSFRGLSDPVFWDLPHRLDLVGMRDLAHDWMISGRMRFTSGFIHNDDFTFAFDALSGEFETLKLGLNNRMEPFYSMDVKLAKEWGRTQTRWTAYIDVQNVTNHRVPEPFPYGVVGEDVGSNFGLPILPILGIEAEFRGD